MMNILISGTKFKVYLTVPFSWHHSKLISEEGVGGGGGGGGVCVFVAAAPTTNNQDILVNVVASSDCINSGISNN